MFSKLCDHVFDFGGKNCNPRFNKQIKKITPHHMAGIMTGVDCARMHYNGCDVSANYYIGADGITGGVDEAKRAWTSNSRENDYEAITIEVSNDNTDPYTISKSCYNDLVRLCADICTRYGITPHYNGKPTGTITVHRMFCATECPSDDLMYVIESGQFERDILACMGQDVPSDETNDFEYVIQKGDTLTGIAKKFNTSVKFLKDLNKIENVDKINTGDILLTGFIYEVEKGDTLTSIAKKFSTTVKRLTTNNQLADPDKIYVGQWLVIR